MNRGIQFTSIVCLGSEHSSEHQSQWSRVWRLSNSQRSCDPLKIDHCPSLLIAKKTALRAGLSRLLRRPSAHLKLRSCLGIRALFISTTWDFPIHSSFLCNRYNCKYIELFGNVNISNLCPKRYSLSRNLRTWFQRLVFFLLAFSSSCIGVTFVPDKSGMSMSWQISFPSIFL